MVDDPNSETWRQDVCDVLTMQIAQPKAGETKKSETTGQAQTVVTVDRYGRSAFNFGASAALPKGSDIFIGARSHNQAGLWGSWIWSNATLIGTVRATLAPGGAVAMDVQLDDYDSIVENSQVWGGQSLTCASPFPLDLSPVLDMNLD